MVDLFYYTTADPGCVGVGEGGGEGAGWLATPLSSPCTCTFTQIIALLVAADSLSDDFGVAVHNH